MNHLRRQLHTAPRKPPRRLFPDHAPLYAVIYSELIETARACGYALAIHGSICTDVDLVAVPWVEDAESARDLVEAICAKLGAESVNLEPNPKPHGRLAWMINAWGGLIDIQVCPRRVDTTSGKD